MARLSYEKQALNLSKAIDIAIDTVQCYPIKGFDQNNLNQFINSYLDFKNSILNPEPEFKNTKSLKYVESDIFTYFQEANGDVVNAFWKKIEENKLPYKRVNKIAKILKRNKIKNQIEYDFIIDVLIPYKEQGLIDNDDMNKINQMIRDFENK